MIVFIYFTLIFKAGYAYFISIVCIIQKLNGNKHGNTKSPFVYLENFDVWINSVYLCWPNPEPSWVLLGYITNQKPSALFRIVNVRPDMHNPSNPFQAASTSFVSAVSSQTRLFRCIYSTRISQRFVFNLNLIFPLVPLILISIFELFYVSLTHI